MCSRHRGAQLEEGAGRCATIRCPITNGSSPMTAGCSTRRGSAKSRTSSRRTGRWSPSTPPPGGFVAIDPQEDLVSQLGDLVAELAGEPIETYQPVRSETVNFDANWKIYTDKFVEGYYIPGVHPKLFAAINFEEFKTTAHKASSVRRRRRARACSIARLRDGPTGRSRCSKAA